MQVKKPLNNFQLTMMHIQQKQLVQLQSQLVHEPNQLIYTNWFLYHSSTIANGKLLHKRT